MQAKLEEHIQKPLVHRKSEANELLNIVESGWPTIQAPTQKVNPPEKTEGYVFTDPSKRLGG